MPIKATTLVILLAFSVAAHSGRLPEEVDEMQYPNVVRPVFEYKSWGLSETDLNDPYTCRYMADGRLLISDLSNHSLKFYNFTTNSIESLQLHNGNGSTLDNILPFAAAPTGDGHIVVVDRHENSLFEFDESGKLIKKYNNPPLGLLEPSKISIKGKHIAVADTGNNRVVIFSKGDGSSTVLGHYGRNDGEFAGPEGVAFDKSGSLYVLDTFNNRVQVFDSELRFLRSWGQWGSYRGFMANPSDIVIGHEDKVFITDLLNHRIQVFDLQGHFLYQFGRHPPTSHEGNGRIHYPTSVSVSEPDGSLVVCEPFESRFQKFALTTINSVANVNDSAWWDKATKFHYGQKAEAVGNHLIITEPDTHAVLFFDLNGRDTKLVEIVGGQGTGPGQFDRPSGAAIDLQRNRVFIGDAGNRRLQEFSIKSSSPLLDKYAMQKGAAIQAQSVKPLAPPEPTTATLEFVASHSLSINTKDVEKLSIEKQSSGTKNQMDAIDTHAGGAAEFGDVGGDKSISPSAPRLGPEGLLYIADPLHNRILVVDPDQSYKILRTIGESADDKALNNPLDLSFSKDGMSIFVVDHYNYRVMKFKIDGTFQSQIGGSGSTPGRFVLPFGIQSGKDGFVYVTDVGGQRVEKFDEDGKFIRQWGHWGTGIGEFYKPKGITQLDDGTLIVLDFGNHRAQMFNQDGEFIRTFGIDNAVVNVSRP